MAPEYGQPLQHLPIIPSDVLKKHHVDEVGDTRFRSAARLLQALWRQDRDLPIGSYRREDGKNRLLGSRISNAAGRAGGNFLTPEIAALVRREYAYREVGAFIDERRLTTNLLSSMPLVFNLLGPMLFDRELASRVLKQCVPNFDGAVQQVLFEHSPGRGHPMLTGDYTAFDALIRYTTTTGKKGFVAIELKYSESMNEPVPEIKPRYDELAASSGLFVEPANPALRTNPLQQLWREHSLAQQMVDAGLYDEGHFMFVFPVLNYHAGKAADCYLQTLTNAIDKVQFRPVTLEAMIEAIREQGEVQHGDALYRRYCDFWLVDGQMELDAPPLRSEVKTTDQEDGAAGARTSRASPKRVRKASANT